MANQTDSTLTGRHVFTLVHGTFAHDANWVSGEQVNTADPDFRQMLSTEMGCNSPEFYDDFKWGQGGIRRMRDLSNKARFLGSQSFKEYLCDVSSNLKDGDRHYIVAHSHGGNIALYALKDPEVRARISGLICLATPFLYPRVRPLSLYVLWSSLLILCLCFYFTEDVSEIFVRVGIDIKPLLSSVWTVGVFSAYALLVMFVTVFRWKRATGDNSRLAKHLAQLSFAGVDLPVLLIRSCGDEATGLLRTGQFLNWLSGLLLSLIERFAFRLIAFSILLVIIKNLLGPEMDLANVREIVDNMLDPLFNLLYAAVLVLLGLTPVFILIIALSRLFVGLDALPWVGELETMTEDSPPGLSSKIVTLPPKRVSEAITLAHSQVYAREETVKEIVKWCDEL